MTTLKYVVIVCAAAVCLCKCACGGVPVFDGDESCFWENRSLVVARIVSSGRFAGTELSRTSPFFITILPKMTLAGSFDCASVGEMRIPIVLGDFGSPLRKLPENGGLCIVHIARSEGGWFVPGMFARYMPEGVPLLEIWGLHDESLLAIKKKVSQIRRDGARKDREMGIECSAAHSSKVSNSATQGAPAPRDLADSRSVVLAKIRTVEARDGGEWLVTMDIMAAVTGSLDSALTNEVTMSIPARAAAGRKLPWKDAEMFVAIEECDGIVVLAMGEIDYMPSGWAFCPVEVSLEHTCNKILASRREALLQNSPAKDKVPRDRSIEFRE